ncbi:hypothetical protein APR04_005775 [Promicromonospora umidemergens]|uniref:Uncharacterized protein n=1 Tax=Promicromonospora umidemergens TaxID=629679 RepID=A0ABP8WLZ8_9MICO|nr:hypothetical protein [Promicromonospora umidemergens]MCP2286835.1 hypothetical protein [Promicromonospora umidemergens]
MSPIFQRAAREWAAMRSEYGDYLEAHIAAAYDATNGVLLNTQGRAAGVSEERLFLAGGTFAAAYASPELREFWAAHPRLTVEAFETAWTERLDATDREELPEHWHTAA